MRRLWLSLALVAAVATLGASVAWTIGHHAPRGAGAAGSGWYGPAMMGRPGMMGGAGPGWSGPGDPSWGAGMMGGPGMGGPGMGGFGMMGGPGMGLLWLAGNGTPVTSIAAARERAAAAAAPAGLHPGEVIWFDNGFYVELKNAAGDPATEVIVDPTGGAVSTEPGPAMMWNTRYGMHRTGTAAVVTPDRARQLAVDWLARVLPGRQVGPPDTYPGYYTLETTAADGTVNGMLSVNSTTGQVWYHSWHGRFIAREDS